MTRVLPHLAAAAALAALAAPALAQPLAFEGRWDCGVAVMEITANSYRPGAGEPALPIERIEASDGWFGLSFADGYAIGLTDVTPDTLVWSSAASGDVFDCVRVAPLRPMTRPASRPVARPYVP